MQKNNYITCSIVIPVYNSENTLPELVENITEILPGLCSDFEIILVNDGSRDQSWSVIDNLTEEYPRVTGLNLMRNYGQHNALLCGIRKARYEVVVTMDDDSQHPPEEIHKLLDKLEEGYDVIYGKPKVEQHGFWRNLASKITKLALKSAMGAQTADDVSAYRAFYTRLRRSFANYTNPFVSIDVLLAWATTRFGSVNIKHKVRQKGPSNYTFRKLIIHALNMITGFSVLPLQLASMTGFLFAIFGLLVLIYVIGRYLIQGGSVPGFPFLASIISIFAGVQLFALGIIGEYLARMYFRLMDRPSYVIRDETTSYGD